MDEDDSRWSAYQDRAGGFFELRDGGGDGKGSNGCDGREELHNVEGDWNDWWSECGTRVLDWRMSEWLMRRS